MKCHEIQELIADALGNEIAGENQTVLDRHLAECGDCRREFERAQVSLRAMRSLAEPPSVAVMRTGGQLVIGTNVESRVRTGVRVFSWMRFAACILIAFVAGYLAATNEANTDDLRAVAPVHRGPTICLAAPGASLESAIASVHQRHPNESPLTKCLLAMATSNVRQGG